MHLNEALVREGATPALDTVLGKTGNTGKNKKGSSYKPHAHIDISTETTGSPWLQYLSTKYTPAVTSSLLRPNSRIYYDPVIFFEPGKYEASSDAYRYP
jgi:murein DD-endopeptidase MepM/ murein hydrolase activator NlpD